MQAFRTASILGMVLLVVLPAIAADGGNHPAPIAAPTVEGTYDPDALSLELNWTVETPEGVSLDDAVYTLREKGIVILQTTSDRVTESLEGFGEGVREYTVTVKIPGYPESDDSPPFRLLKDVEVPSDCQVASVSIYTRPPGAQYTVYEECLPG